MFAKTVMATIILIVLFIGIYGGGVMNQRTARAGQEISLPEPVADGELSVEKAISQRRSVRSFSDEPLTLDQVSQILWSAQGITDKRRNFRAAPSAGATYPLEVYLASGRIDGLEAGVFRYVPQDHSLVRVMEGDQRDDLYNKALRQDPVRSAPAVMVIAGVFKRTTSRYGSRGENYVYMEVGHAGQNIHLQAEALGLGTVVIGAFDDSGVQKVLGLPRETIPFYIMPVGNKSGNP